MVDHDKEAPGAHGFQFQQDTRTPELNQDQHNSSSMNPSSSSGMGSNNTYGSGPRSDDEPDTYQDSKFNGWSLSTLTLMTNPIQRVLGWPMGVTVLTPTPIYRWKRTEVIQQGLVSDTKSD
ncbi:hypothetical protein N7463_001387 [Penicillium fimorum]|uniref:Uncharacterized protein n=1 Tax=Penicillium fimorum TaxID=1882269 RepID=A0A9X0CC05_9EURO|nr:hypothetical protein N7463_001387 [Penicillium fimorum]